MDDPLIFALDDVRKIRKVSVNVDDFSQYAQEVQRNFVSKIIGDTLYNALLTNIDNPPLSQRFINLLDGVTYQDGGRDVNFRGIRLYASYLWLYTYSIDSNIQHTPIGAMIFKDEYADQGQYHKGANEARSHFINSADGMEESILKYLDLHLNVYPEYTDSFQSQPAKQSNNTFKVIGKSYRPPTTW